MEIKYQKHNISSYKVTFLNEPELICLHTVKWFQVLLSNTSNSIKHKWLQV